MNLSYTAGEQDSGKTVYTILRRELMISETLTRRLKQAGAIFVDGQPVFSNRIVEPGEIVTADLAAAEPPCDVVPEDGDLNILYEENGMLAVNKPAGLLTHPSRARYTGTLANRVAGYLLRTTGDGRCHAVGRLDRDTSGVVVFAANSYMKARLSHALGQQDAKKVYLALVYGVVDEPTGVIDRPIRRLQERDMRRIVAPDGQRAVTYYETLGVRNVNGLPVSLLRLTLETGRTHQIRVHCHDAGHPILGDVLYYTAASRTLSAALGIDTQALHARRVSLTLPLSGEYLTVKASLPDAVEHLFGVGADRGSTKC